MNKATLNFFVTLAYNRNDRSTLTSILFHFSFNFSLSLMMPISLLAATTTGLWLTVREAFPLPSAPILR